MSELDDIFSALAGDLSGIVPQSTVSSGLGTVLQAATPQNAASSERSTVLQAVVPQSAASSVLGTVLQAATPQSATTSSGGNSTIENIAMDVLKSGFGLVPIIGGLLGLFGGGGSDPLPALTQYQMPEAIDYQAAEVGGAIENTDYSQSGAARPFGGVAGAGSLPGITVNVQAMDARSFLDRSSDIAAAVKDAMLNLNSINDVVNDL